MHTLGPLGGDIYWEYYPNHEESNDQFLELGTTKLSRLLRAIDSASPTCSKHSESRGSSVDGSQFLAKRHAPLCTSVVCLQELSS